MGYHSSSVCAFVLFFGYYGRFGVCNTRSGSCVHSNSVALAKAAKKAGASAERGGNGYANKPTGSVPQSTAPKNSVVVAPGRHVPKISFTHEKNAYTPDNGDKYIAQLNGFLKNGIIERSEYNYLLKKYRNNYTK